MNGYGYPGSPIMPYGGAMPPEHVPGSRARPSPGPIQGRPGKWMIAQSVDQASQTRGTPYVLRGGWGGQRMTLGEIQDRLQMMRRRYERMPDVLGARFGTRNAPRMGQLVSMGWNPEQAAGTLGEISRREIGGRQETLLGRIHKLRKIEKALSGYRSTPMYMG